jgi:hypothetical protein
VSRKFLPQAFTDEAQQGRREERPALARRIWLPLLGSAVTTEILYLLLLALAFPSSLAAGAPLWFPPLIFGPAEAAAALMSTVFPPAPTGPPIAIATSLLLVATLCYSLLVLGLFGFGEAPIGAGRYVLLGVLGAALIFGVTLLPLSPLSSTAASSLFSGRLIALYGADPWLTPPAAASNDPYLPWLVQQQGPVVYGPLWEALCAGLALLPVTASPAMGILILKGLLLLTHLFNSLLIWRILGKLAPQQRLAGTLLYAWNPLALIALAGNGQQEGLLLCLLLLAVWLHVQPASSVTRMAVPLLLGLAAALNLIAFLLIPLYLCACLAEQRGRLAAAADVLWRALLSLGSLIACYLPFWHGAASYVALTTASGWFSFHSSLAAMLEPALQRLYRPLAFLLDSPQHRQPALPADLTVKGVALLLFLCFYLYLLAYLRDRSPQGNARAGPAAPRQQLLTAWSAMIGVWLLLMTFNFWPWYALWALWVAVLRPLDALSRSLLLLSATALPAYALLDVQNGLLLALEGLLIFAPPLVYLTGVFFHRRREALKETKSGA